jgi:hypothetical protein
MLHRSKPFGLSLANPWSMGTAPIDFARDERVDAQRDTARAPAADARVRRHAGVLAVLRPAALGLFLWLSLASSGCSGTHRVDEVEVAGPTLRDNGALGLTPAQVRRRLWDTLDRDRRFRLIVREKNPEDRPEAVQLVFELGYTREVDRAGAPGPLAEVGGTLAIHRREGEGSVRAEVTASASVPLDGSGPQAGRAAMQRALDAVLRDAVRLAELRLSALEATESRLLADLKGKDLEKRDAAVAVLADRKHPAAIPPLIERLRDPNPDRARSALGALVELKAQQAVPTVIDLMKGRAPGEAQELVFALGGLGGEEAEAFLFTVAQGHDQRWVQEAAVQALQELRSPYLQKLPNGGPSKGARAP